MGKLYYTNDVKKLIEGKISTAATKLINDETLEETTAVMTIRQMRLMKKFGMELISEMEALDKAYDEEMAAYRTEKAKEEANEQSS